MKWFISDKLYYLDLATLSVDIPQTKLGGQVGFFLPLRVMQKLIKDVGVKRYERALQD